MLSFENSVLMATAESGGGDAIEPAPALVALEHGQAADIEAEAARVDQGLGQRRDIL